MYTLNISSNKLPFLSQNLKNNPIFPAYGLGPELRKKNGMIKSLGSVELQIDFSGTFIDTEEYDRINETGTNGRETAAAVIAKLRPSDNKSSTPRVEQPPFL